MAILIEHGLIKVAGNVDKDASQYSLDNLKRLEASQTDTPGQTEEFISNLKVNLLSPVQTTPEQPVKFEVIYNVKEDIKTYIAFSLTDADRNIWIYNDNSMDDLTKGRGEKRAVYECSLSQVNNLKLKLQVSVRNDKDEMIAYDLDEKIIIISRSDIPEEDLSAKDSSTGLLLRNGEWHFG